MYIILCIEIQGGLHSLEAGGLPEPVTGGIRLKFRKPRTSIQHGRRMIVKDRIVLDRNGVIV
jgi:hypothetical protein